MIGKKNIFVLSLYSYRFACFHSYFHCFLSWSDPYSWSIKIVSCFYWNLVFDDACSTSVIFAILKGSEHYFFGMRPVSVSHHSRFVKEVTFILSAWETVRAECYLCELTGIHTMHWPIPFYMKLGTWNCSEVIDGSTDLESRGLERNSVGVTCSQFLNHYLVALLNAIYTHRYLVSFSSASHFSANNTM